MCPRDTAELSSAPGGACIAVHDSRGARLDLAGAGAGTTVALDRSVCAATATAVRRLRSDAVTSVELVWQVPPPVLPLPRATPGVMSTPLLPSMHELADVARAIAGEVTFQAAARRLELEAKRLTHSIDSLCVGFDWPRRAAWSSQGPITNEAVKELVAQVAGSGRWSLLGNALVVPIGQAPARAVLALRRPGAYQLAEAGLVSALCGGVAAPIERLLSARP